MPTTITAPPVLTAHFAEIPYPHQTGYVRSYPVAGYTGPLTHEVIGISPPICVRQWGLCDATQQQEILYGKMRSTFTINDLNALQIGHLGSCWKMDAHVENLQTGGYRSADKTTQRLRYWIDWCQVAYAPPS